MLPGVAAYTRVCTYDRPGTLLDLDHRSRSELVLQPRTAADAVADLHALLTAADVPGPYLLVGHSLGGVIVRLFAATYPAVIAGLVLIDSSHEDQNIRFQEALTPDQWEAFNHLTRDVPPELSDYPEFEQMDFDASFAQLRTAVAAHPLPALPLVVLTHGIPADANLSSDVQATLPPGFPWAIIERVSQE